MRLSREAAIALIALTLAIVMPRPAQANELTPVTGVVVHHDDGTVQQAVHVADLYPTAVREVVLFLDGDDPAAARRMEIGVVSLTNSENGCNRPESNTGDITCTDEDGQGELSSYLGVTVAAGRESSDGEQRRCTPDGQSHLFELEDLQTDPAVVGLPDDEGVLCVLAAFEHYERVDDNVTQTDSIEFDLRLRFDSTVTAPGEEGEDGTDESDVLGTRFEHAVTPDEMSSGQLNLSLPRTGLPVESLLIGGGLLLGAGAALMLVNGHRQEPGSLS